MDRYIREIDGKVVEMVDIIEAHKRSIHHRPEIEASGKCGCFYCLEIFEPGAITEWVDDDDTALCPHCGIDSVIGDASGYPIDGAFLTRMHGHWFMNEV
ncbi:cytoplasmic protein [Brucella anthropi]|uniref:cytoplasmic protein n=1 Tax=Brucella anthropi TaxID=529 RepID=UPI00366BC567